MVRQMISRFIVIFKNEKGGTKLTFDSGAQRSMLDYDSNFNEREREREREREISRERFSKHFNESDIDL
jgi:hypothetical protein